MSKVGDKIFILDLETQNQQIRINYLQTQQTRFVCDEHLFLNM